MRHGCEAWLMLVQPTSHVVAIEVDMCAGVGEGSELQPKTSRWNNLVSEFADVFELPGMPAEHDTMHIIELEPSFMPPFRCRYQVSAAKLVKIHR